MNRSEELPAVTVYKRQGNVREERWQEQELTHSRTRKEVEGWRVPDPLQLLFNSLFATILQVSISTLLIKKLKL